MTVRLRAGGATDIGQVRAVNQDSMLVGTAVSIVADGMGGHQGGEVASAMVIDAFEAEAAAERVTVNGLIARVQDANEAVFERSAGDPGLSGMGTTLVAVGLVVEDGEERLAVINVGDSRAYRLADGVLEQVSEDHSLVGEMVRDGRITREQAQTHPQKNIVTRAVGIDPTVEVDDFQILPHAGDRYLLCSDGLTDEVDEDDIATVLRTIDDPEEAAADLVRRANENGGRDNVTVVIVDVVDDGGVSAAASERVPDADGFSHDPETDTETFLALPDDQAHVHQPRTDDAATTTAPDSDVIADESMPRRPRAVTVRSVAFVLVVLALIGGGLWLVNDYTRNTYFATIQDDEVVIFRGRPGGFLWFDPSYVRSTGIDADDVPPEFLDDLDGGVSRPTLASVERFVANVEERIDELAPPPTTTTTTTTSTTTSLPGSTAPTTTSN